MLGDPIRESLAALVEDDYPRERGESVQDVLVGRQFPVEFEVRQRSRHQHDVARAVAEEAICYVNIAAPGVFDLTIYQLPILPSIPAFGDHILVSRPDPDLVDCKRTRRVDTYFRDCS